MNALLPSVFNVGDSIALHYRPFLAQYSASMLTLRSNQEYAAALADLDHPRGANCGDSSRVVPVVKFLFEQADARPDWLLFNCGLHDIKTDPATRQRQVDLPEYTQNLAAVLDLARANSVRTAWISTTPVDDARHLECCREFLRFERDVQSYNEAAAAAMRRHGVPILDLHRFTDSLPGEKYVDHVHFNEETRKLQAAFLAGQLAGLRC